MWFFIGLFGFVLWLWGCFHLAISLRLHPAHGLLGILWIVGLLILLWIGKSARDPRSRYHHRSSARKLTPRRDPNDPW